MAGVAWLAWLLVLPPRPSAWLIAGSGLPLLIYGSWASARDLAREPWRLFMRRTADIHAVLLVLLAALGVQFADAHGVTTDGVIYFSQLRSVIFDGDLDVAAEFAYLRQPPRPSHVVPIGPTFVWLPLYLAVAIADTLGRTLHVWTAPPEPVGVGLTLAYIRAALVSSFFIGAAGLVVVHRRVRQDFSPGISLAATLVLFLATPLVWYMVYEPSMTHAASFGFVALFVVAAERYTAAAMSVRHAMLLGGLLGLAFLTRPQEAVFALFPATLLLLGNEPVGARWRACGRLAGWAFIGAAPLLALQALHSSILLRREAFALTGERGYLDLLDSRWADTLWSSWHGLFSWSPVVYVAFIALFLYIARDRRWGIAAVVIVLTMAWVNGATADWAGGWSFGGRRFISVLVLLAPALAFVLHGLTRRPLIPLGVVALAAIAWNQLLIAQYRTGRLRPGADVTFGQIVRQQAALATEPPFFYPFAFPANVWFALRTGLAVDRYDLLGAERLSPAIDVSMTASGRYLLDGWAGRVSDPFGELRWIESARAELLLPLDPLPGRNMAIEVQARTRLLDPPESVALALLVNGQEIGTFTPEAKQASTTTFTLSPGSNPLRRGFNRVVFERRSGTAPVGIYRIRVKN